MFGKPKKEVKKIVYDPETFNGEEEPTHVIWERYNSDTGEVEATAEIEIFDEDALEAINKLCDDKKAEGDFEGFAFVYETKGVRKLVRPKDNKYPEL